MQRGAETSRSTRTTMQQVAFDVSSLLWGWLVHHARGPLGPGALWQLCLLPLLLGVAVFACLPDSQGRRRHDYSFLGLTLLAILLGVLPSLSKDYLQVDEAAFVAGACNVAFDP